MLVYKWHYFFTVNSLFLNSLAYGNRDMTLKTKNVRWYSFWVQDIWISLAALSAWFKEVKLFLIIPFFNLQDWSVLCHSFCVHSVMFPLESYFAYTHCAWFVSIAAGTCCSILRRRRPDAFVEWTDAWCTMCTREYWVTRVQRAPTNQPTIQPTSSGILDSSQLDMVEI